MLRRAALLQRHPHHVRPLLLLPLLALALLLPVAGSGAEPTQPRVAIFFYPWYGTPARDGAYAHWTQAGATPPRSIASSFYPRRGVYSSSDTSLLGTQLDEIRSAHVDQLVVSWWGRGSAEDARLPAILAAASARGLSVAAHVEPYADRTVASVGADLAYLRGLGITDVYVYRPFDLPVAEWAALDHGGSRLFAETSLVGRARDARFDGLYTYDVLARGAGTFARTCEQARRVRLLCSPSVGPGYDARRAGLDARVKARRNGATYDSMWRAAIRAKPDVITITSYNEWHEGTQIEPAGSRSGYESYDGAWGLRGERASRAYLGRTAYWSDVFRTSAPQPSTSAS
jgi:glycoprotein endo-alpha-1,2-mannosidase